MSSAPAEHSGIASAINNDVARFGGLLAVAVLPALAGITGTAYLHPATLAAGFRTAALISGAMCAAGGLLAAFTITNPARVPGPPERPHSKSASTAASTHHRSPPLLASQPARNDVTEGSSRIRGTSVGR